MEETFIMLKRTEITNDLIECHPNAFLLLTQIALRARRTPNLIKKLDVCECQIGDFKSCGLTEQKYRTAKKVLESLGLVTFHATSKGTIAKLANTAVYNINVCELNGQANDQPTDKQRTANGQATTNNNENKENKYSDEIKNFTASFQNYILKENPTKAPKVNDSLLDKCNEAIEKLIRLDEFELDYITSCLWWAVKDDFWSGQVFSLGSLRTKSKNGLKKFQNLSNAFDKQNFIKEEPTKEYMF